MTDLPWRIAAPLAAIVCTLGCFAYLAYDEWRKEHRRRNHRMARGEHWFNNAWDSNYRAGKL